MAKFTTLEEYLASIENRDNAETLREITEWTLREFPTLALRIAWNQPMLTDHGTFIISYTASKANLSIAVEEKPFEKFLPQIKAAGYKNTKKLFQIPWSAEIDKALLTEIITFVIADKKDVTTFWAPSA